MKVAFYTATWTDTRWGGSTVWNNFGKEDWVYGSAEKGWSVVTDELFKGDPGTILTITDKTIPLFPSHTDSTTWFGGSTVKGVIRLRLFDICRLEYHDRRVIRQAEAYVEQGGKLLASIPHLSTNDVRNQEFSIIRNGDVSDLFGVVVKGPDVDMLGRKFIEESTVDGCLYPCTKDEACDPMCADGLIRSADIEMKGGKVIAVLSDRFFNTFENVPHFDGVRLR